MVPIGGIISWSGSIADIPSNYNLCDGSNGTPDLRDKFIIGAGSVYDVGATGGASSHCHTPSAAPLFVTEDGVDQAWAQAVPTTTVSNLPPYLAVAQIQRIS